LQPNAFIAVSTCDVLHLALKSRYVLPLRTHGHLLQYLLLLAVFSTSQTSAVRIARAARYVGRCGFQQCADAYRRCLKEASCCRTGAIFGT